MYKVSLNHIFTFDLYSINKNTEILNINMHTHSTSPKYTNVHSKS